MVTLTERFPEIELVEEFVLVAHLKSFEIIFRKWNYWKSRILYKF